MNQLKRCRTMFATCILAGFGIVAIANDGALAAQHRKAERGTPAPPPSAIQILEWLPVDTETFIVANGPFRLRFTGDDDVSEHKPLDTLLERFTYSPWEVRKGVLIKELSGQQPLLAVEGARHFRLPSGLGPSTYQGCHVLVFRRDLGATGEALKKRLKSAGAKALKIAGREIFTLDEKLENDVLKFYFAQPQPNVLICATDQNYLKETLQRMDQRAAKRALPPDLPEWKHVDTTSRFWGIRHYGKDVDAGSRSLAIQHFGKDTGDAQGGMVFSYNPGERREEKSSAKVKLLWPDKNIDEVKKDWTSADEATWKTKVQQVAPGVIEITARPKRDDDGGNFFLTLLFLLGHVMVF